MGLSPDLLRTLLQHDSGKGQAVGQTFAAKDTNLLAEGTQPELEQSKAEEALEFEYLSDNEDGETSPTHRRTERLLSISSPRRFRVRLKSQGEEELADKPVKQTMNVRQALNYGEGRSTVDVGNTDSDGRPRHTHKTVSRAAEVKAEYVFAG